MHKILIAEDDPTMLSLLCTLLELEGYQTIPYHENESIVDTVRREHPAILLMDIHMNDQDGIEITRQIKQDPNLSPAIIVLQSGMDLREQSYVAGADAFLLKPYMPDSLLQILREALI